MVPGIHGARRWRRARVGVAALALAACPLLLGAQQPPATRNLRRTVQIHVRSARMADVLTDLSAHYGLRVLADGVPLRNQATIDFDGALRDALDRIADSFDYTWTTTRSGIVLMSKRHRLPEERPQLNLPELRQTVKDMLTALPDVPPNEDYEASASALVVLARSFTPQQWQVLRGGGQLRWGDLSPQQRMLEGQAIVLHNYGSPRAMWARLGFQLDHMATSEVRAVPPPGSPAPGTALRLRYITHIARDRGGLTVEERLGQTEKEIVP